MFRSFSKTVLTAERILVGQYFLAVDLSSTVLNTGTTDETLQQSGKQGSFRQTYWIVQLVCIKGQANRSLKPSLE